ncbi:GH13852 [Drosophila grimshawi]|uniref:GH13852 n=1 Tax=Drosophila grimshawi TaxID=7222 RepID=B4JP21_DROGR|nr:GH13852 [Drosophila grimshawi]
MKIGTNLIPFDRNALISKPIPWACIIESLNFIRGIKNDISSDTRIQAAFRIGLGLCALFGGSVFLAQVIQKRRDDRQIRDLVGSLNAIRDERTLERE